MNYPRREKMHTWCSCSQCTGWYIYPRVNTLRRDERRTLHKKIRRSYKHNLRSLNDEVVILSLWYTD